MGTVVTMHVVRENAPGAAEAMDRAFGWFYEIEERCSRFKEESELRRLQASPRVPVSVSTILFQAVRFACLAAEQTDGAFDPTLGSGPWQSIEFDDKRQAITLHEPLTLDLGAVAKGLAVDMAAQDLAQFKDFAIDAGGDLYLGGRNAEGAHWPVGIRHPRRDGEVIGQIAVSDRAVCTSGDYERGLHIMDARAGAPARQLASATVIAPTAMLADALATAAFVMGPGKAIALLERMDVEGLLVTPELEQFRTKGLPLAA
jgi:thiamine biosynthesis lipoprotein